MTIPTIGEQHFSDEKAKDYPDLTFKVQKGAVRTYWYALGSLKFEDFNSRVQPILHKRLMAQLDETLSATEHVTGLRRPSLQVGSCIFDEDIPVVEITLCEVEQEALRRMYHSVHRTKLNQEDVWRKLYHVLSDHIINHGGYDHSRSIDNSSYLHAESPKVQRYLAEHGSPMFRTKPLMTDEFLVLPTNLSPWQKFVAQWKLFLRGPDCSA